jgi:TonB family protein
MKTPLQLFAGLTLALTISLLNPNHANAQTQDPEQQDIFFIVEQMPNYEGGEKALLQYLSKNIRYRKDQPEGVVIASFVINPDKSVSDIAILRGVDRELDEECRRVLESTSGQWTPGSQSGTDVRVRYTVPIRFAQDKTEPEPAANQPAPVADTMPEHKEGIVGMLNFINQNLAHNRAKSPEGLSVLSFIVHEDGTFSDYQVVRSLTPALDAEALRVTKLMSGNWKPGTQQGQPVKVKYTLPIRFTAHRPKLIKEEKPKQVTQESPQEIKQDSPKQLQQVGPRQLPENELRALQGDAPFAMVDQMPTYEGGQDELMRFLRETVPSARNQKGLSVFSFIVNRDGSISDVEVIKSAHAVTDGKIAEALKNTSGKWTPGQQFEYKVRVSYTLPINYPLPKTK